MRRSVVFTFITDDKPGIVDQLSSTVSQCGGNWLESRMTKLAGKFAGIVQISIAEDKLENLRSTLQQLADKDINIIIDDLRHEDESTALKSYKLAVIGLDRPGIVKELAQALAARSFNVVDMHSLIESAPMTGEPLFKAEATITCDSSKNTDTFEDELESICNQLDIDWNFDEV